MTISGVSYQEWLTKFMATPPWWATNHTTQLVVIFSGVLVLAYVFWHQAETESTKDRKPLPDMSLRQLLYRIIGVHDLSDKENVDPKKYQEGHQALVNIREKANLGVLTVFGRVGDAFEGNDAHFPRGLIPRDHWEKFHIDYMSVVRTDTPDCTMTSAREQGFNDLWFCGWEIDKIWPRKRRTIHWRRPFVLR